MLAHNVDVGHGSKNLLQRGILYRHEKVLLRQERLHAQTEENNVYVLDRFSLIFLDQCIRLGSRLLWCKILSVCFSGMQRGHPENPYEKD